VSPAKLIFDVLSDQLLGSAKIHESACLIRKTPRLCSEPSRVRREVNALFTKKPRGMGQAGLSNREWGGETQ